MVYDSLVPIGAHKTPAQFVIEGNLDSRRELACGYVCTQSSILWGTSGVNPRKVLNLIPYSTCAVRHTMFHL